MDRTEPSLCRRKANNNIFIFLRALAPLREDILIFILIYQALFHQRANSCRINSTVLSNRFDNRFLISFSWKLRFIENTFHRRNGRGTDQAQGSVFGLWITAFHGEVFGQGAKVNIKHIRNFHFYKKL